MSLWEDLGDFLGAAGETTAGGIGLSWDLATAPIVAPFTEKDERAEIKQGVTDVWQDATSTYRAAKTPALDVLKTVFEIPGIKQAAEAQYWLYSNAISQPISTASLLVSDQSTTQWDLSASWKAAEDVSPGQALMANANGPLQDLTWNIASDEGTGFGTQAWLKENLPWYDPSFDLTNADDREAAFEDSSFGKVTSGSFDAAVGWYGDPTRGIGRLASRAYRASTTTVIRSQDDLLGLYDDARKHQEFLTSGGTSGKRTGFGQLIEDSTTMSPSELLFDRRIQASSRPELLASLLGHSDDYSTNALIVRGASGDEGALHALRETDASTWDSIQIAKGNLEVTQARILERLGGRENLLDKDGNLVHDWDYDNLPGLADDVDLYQTYKDVHDDLIAKDEWLAKTIELAASPPINALKTKGASLSTLRGAAARGRADRKLTKTGFWSDETVSGFGKRAVRVISWVGDESPSGWVNIKGGSANNSTREIVAALSKVKTWGDEAGAAKKQFWVDSYIDATSQAERMDILLRMEKDVLYDVGRKALGSGDDVASNEAVKHFIDTVYDQHHRARTRAATHLSQRSFMVDADGTIIKAPQFESQLADSVPMADFKMYEDLLGRHSSVIKNSLGYGKDALANGYDLFASVWRPLTLLRLGYTIRNVGEGELRTMAYFDGMMNIDPLILGRNSAAFRAGSNLNSRLTSAQVRVFGGRRKKAELIDQAAVLRANRYSREKELGDLVDDEAVLVRSYRGAAGPAAMRRDDYYAGMVDPLQPQLQPKRVAYRDIEVGIASPSKSLLGSRERTRYFSLKEKAENLTNAERAELVQLSRKAAARHANEQKKAGYRLAYRDADGSMKYADKVSEIPDSAFDPTLAARAQRKLDDRNVRRVSRDEEPVTAPLQDPEIHLVPSHERLVKEAQGRTEVVPEHVLGDYPRLAKRNPEDEYIYRASQDIVDRRELLRREMDLIDGELEQLRLQSQYLARNRKRKGTAQDADMIRYTPPANVARAPQGYRAKTGIGEEVDVDLQQVVVDNKRAAEMVKAYDNAVEVSDDTIARWRAGDRDGITGTDRQTLESYDAFAAETAEQFRYLTEDLGIEVRFVTDDPYPDALAMATDVRNGRLSVFATGTEASGQHPFLTNLENDQFRAVHDAFGHAAVGRAFDRHGEDAAWLHHSAMFSPVARRAMTTETRGQNSWFNFKDPKKKEFPRQKVALLDAKFSDLSNVKLDAAGDVIRRGGVGHFKVGGHTLPDAFEGPKGRAGYIAASADQRRDLELFGPSSRVTSKADLHGAWIAVKPTDPAYWDSLATVANRQFRHSPMVMKLLKGEEPEAVASWLVRDRQGRQALKGLGVDADDAFQHVQKVAQMVDRYVPDPALQAAIARGDVSALELKAALAGRTDLAPVHGMEAGKATNVGNYAAHLRDKASKKGFELLGSIPEDVATRHPFYRRVYQDELKRTIGLRQSQGVALTQRDLDDLITGAHSRALRETKATLYTIERYSNAAAKMRFFMPFFASWENSMRTWAGLAKNNGSVVPSILMLTQMPNRMGWVTDSNGDKVGVGEEGEGGEYLTVQLGTKGLPDWAARGIESMNQMGIPKGSLNLVMQGEPWYFPGLGPVGQIPLSELAKRKPGVGQVMQDMKLIPFGPSEKFMSWDMAAPAWMKRGISLMQGESDVTYANSMAMIMATERMKFRLGQRDTEPTMAEIEDRTNKLFGVRMLANMTLPFAPNFQSPFQMYFDEYRRMKSEDPENADAQFLDKYPEYYEAMMSLSKNPTGAWATVDSAQRSQKFAPLVAELGELDPSLVALVVNNGAYDPADFSDSAQAFQYTNTLGPGSTQNFRETQSPEAAVKAVDIKKGWTEYMQLMNLVGAVMEDRGLTSMQQSGAADVAFVVNQWRLQQAELNPAWWYDYNERDAGQYAKNVSGLESIVSNETFMAEAGDDPKWLAVQSYLDSRAMFQSELERRDAAGGSADINAVVNADLKYVWDQFTGELTNGSTEFADIYTRYLENDTLGVVPNG